jgi:hypothetical protein
MGVMCGVEFLGKLGSGCVLDACLKNHKNYHTENKMLHVLMIL